MTETVDLIGSLPTRGSYSRRRLTDISVVVLHHSVSYQADEERLVRSIADYHVGTHGWPGIGYHECVGRDGTIYLTNELEAVSYHARAVANPIGVGVCLLGDYRTMQVTPAQMDALLAELLRLDAVVREASGGRLAKLDVKPHSFYVPTICPGDNVRRVIPQLEQRGDAPPEDGQRERIARLNGLLAEIQRAAVTGTDILEDIERSLK